MIAGTHFPEGTSVGCMPAALHLNPAVFGEDAHEYRPERWLLADPEGLRKMESSHMGLSRGRRVCLGQHIAMMQMKKVVAAMVLNFDETRHSSMLTLPSGQTVDVKSEASLDVDEIPIIDVSAIWSDDIEAKKAIAE
ncbi:hypothetical protein LTR17_023555 [Elasticomyces elasticus]|nr:hypothetical protein LTR17_023555 [Elasticomyces elasticus]